MMHVCVLSGLKCKGVVAYVCVIVYVCMCVCVVVYIHKILQQALFMF